MVELNHPSLLYEGSASASLPIRDNLVRARGIEPLTKRWQRLILPIN
jgi:hypothetical protein